MGYILPVALSFCSKDYELAYLNMQWQVELGGRGTDIVLSYDTLTSDRAVEEIEREARKIYERVSRFMYPAPTGNIWPPNQAFQQTAWHMAKQDKSWFWFEPDCVPLCPGWLEILSRRYHQCGKKFYAPLVADLGHYNGTGVYPHDTPGLIPHAMRETHTAWDMVMRAEMSHLAADAMPVLYHAWTVDNGRFNASAGGEPARFSEREQFRQLPPSVVLFHRDKTASVIRFLQECMNERTH